MLISDVVLSRRNNLYIISVLAVQIHFLEPNPVFPLKTKAR